MTYFSELPLVFFTTLSQMAVGAFILMYVLEKKSHISEAAADCVSKLVVVLMVLAMGASSTHLGDPLGGVRALLGITHSWLSREIFFMGGFLGLAFLYALPFLKKMRGITGALGTIFGVLGIVATAMVYTLPARPAWDVPYPLFFFALTALAAGPLLVSYIAYRQDGKICQEALKLTSIMLLLGFMVSVLYVLLQGSRLDMPLGWLALRCVLGQLVPAAMLQQQAKGTASAGNGLRLCLLLVTVGELLGHQLFYVSVLPYPLFPFQ